LTGYAIAADALVALHFAFVVFVIAGGLLALRWRWAPVLHLPAAAWGVWIEWSGGLCPLTPLENRLRAAAGEATYPGDFLGHYLLALLYPDGLTREVQWLLGGLALAVNAAVYGWVWRRTRRCS
jgi:hypothetical protein